MPAPSESWTQVSLLEACREPQWTRFVEAHPAALGFYGLNYRDFLQQAVPGSVPQYLMAERGGVVVGVMPAMLRREGPFGPVLNALPFYGSNGAPLVSDDADGGATVTDALLAAFDAIAEREDVVSSTIVGNPLDARGQACLDARAADCRDSRIGQITWLPADADADDDDARERALLDSYHQKTRNIVRKAMKSGVTVTVDDSPDGLAALAALHSENMAVIGGLAKSADVFRALGECFEAGRSRRLWVASHAGSPIAYLLLLYHGHIVEYFAPAVHAEARALQPLSLLVHRAMADAVARGARCWNWGGTWRSQHGVHQFKRRWGTTDIEYRYSTRIRHAAVLQSPRAVLLDGYPSYYVLPFDRLAS